MFKSKNQEQEPDLEMFVIYDTKSNTYGNPTYEKNRHVLIRETLNMMKDPAQAKNPILLNAEDFSVFKIGNYYKKTGVLEAHQQEHVANMHDLRSMVQRETQQPALSST